MIRDNFKTMTYKTALNSEIRYSNVISIHTFALALFSSKNKDR